MLILIMFIYSAAFAVAEMLAYGQHATQFYLYFVCSARFRQALCRKFRIASSFICRLIFQESVASAEAEPRRPANQIQLRMQTLRSPRLRHVYRFSSSSNHCQHQFLWANPHLLVCRVCNTPRLVHHPSCVHFHEENRVNCECLGWAREHPPHIIVHLGAQRSPLNRVTYRL